MGSSLWGALRLKNDDSSGLVDGQRGNRGLKRGRRGRIGVGDDYWWLKSEGGGRRGHSMVLRNMIKVETEDSMGEKGKERGSDYYWWLKTRGGERKLVILGRKRRSQILGGQEDGVGYRNCFWMVRNSLWMVRNSFDLLMVIGKRGNRGLKVGEGRR